MQRSYFLRVVGVPDDTLARARARDEEAQALWDTIRAEFFTAAGTVRKRPASREAQEVRRQVDALRDEARELRRRAARQRDAWDDPWSHTRPDALDRWGLHEVAGRVREAYERFIAEAEAA